MTFIKPQSHYDTVFQMLQEMPLGSLRYMKNIEQHYAKSRYPQLFDSPWVCNWNEMSAGEWGKTPEEAVMKAYAKYKESQHHAPTTTPVVGKAPINVCSNYPTISYAPTGKGSSYRI